MKKEKQIIKLNLSLEKDFYDLLKKKASGDYIRVSTWVKQFLMKSLIKNNGKKSKNFINDENSL